MHAALVMGAAFILIFFLLAMVNLDELEFVTASVYNYVLIGLWIFALFFQKISYNKIKDNIDETDTVVSRIQKLSSAKLIVWASFEGLAIASSIFLQIIPNIFFLISAVAAIGMMILHRITRKELHQDFKIVNELK